MKTANFHPPSSVLVSLLAALTQLSAFHSQPASAQTPTPDDFNPGTDGIIYSLAVQTDGRLLVGGYFTRLAGQPRRCLGQLMANGVLESGFNPGVNDVVRSLGVQPDAKILVGGTFTLAGGQSHIAIVRLNPNGTLDNTFSPTLQGGIPYYTPSSVYSLAVQEDGKILVGGAFASVGGQPRDGIARLNADGTLDPGFDPGASGSVSSLAVQADRKILVGGRLPSPGGLRNGIARLHADGPLDDGFTVGADGAVNSLAVQGDGMILVGGSFATLGGQPRNRIARLNADGTLDNGFNPGASGGSNPSVDSLVVQADGKILVGGAFKVLGGQPRSGIARLNADGTLDSGFDPGANNPVYSLTVQTDGKILVGGGFTTLGGQPRTNIARLNNTEPATQNLTYDGATIVWLRGGTSPEIWRTTFEVSTNGSDWIALGPGSRIPGGWQLPGVSLPLGATIRARGYVAGASWLLETRLPSWGAPQVLAGDGSLGFGTYGFGFHLSGLPGQVVAVECSSNLLDWLPLQTNTLDSGLFYFSDPAATGKAQQFYRARVVP